MEQLYNTVKVKRYTHARIRRLALSAFLGLDNEFFMKPPPYVRVLGFNEKGREHLAQAAGISPIPIITRVSDIEKLSCGAKRLFARRVPSDGHVLACAARAAALRSGVYREKLLKRSDFLW